MQPLGPAPRRCWRCSAPAARRSAARSASTSSTATSSSSWPARDADAAVPGMARAPGRLPGLPRGPREPAGARRRRGGRRRRPRIDRDAWLRRRTFDGAGFDPEELPRASAPAACACRSPCPSRDVADTVGRDRRGGPRALDGRPAGWWTRCVVIDSASADDTAREAAEAGAEVHRARDVLPGLGRRPARARRCWKSLAVVAGDLVVWLDADVAPFDPAFVPGLLGPLLHLPAVGYVKGFYRRDLHGRPDDGGRVTEICARPLINLFYPELAGFVQPLAGEAAGRTEALRRVALLHRLRRRDRPADRPLGRRYGLGALAQVDLGARAHRHQTTAPSGAWRTRSPAACLELRRGARGAPRPAPGPAAPLEGAWRGARPTVNSAREEVASSRRSPSSPPVDPPVAPADHPDPAARPAAPPADRPRQRRAERTARRRPRRARRRAGGGGRPADAWADRAACAARHAAPGGRRRSPSCWSRCPSARPPSPTRAATTSWSWSRTSPSPRSASTTCCRSSGVAHVGYLPGDRIVGLSKLPAPGRAPLAPPAGAGAAHHRDRGLARGGARAEGGGRGARGHPHVHEPARRAPARRRHHHLGPARPPARGPAHPPGVPRADRPRGPAHGPHN